MIKPSFLKTDRLLNGKEINWQKLSTLEVLTILE